MPELTLYGRRVRTVFDLLGKKENDLTYSVGWGLAQSSALVDALLADVFPGAEIGTLQGVRLQEFVAGGGFTDIEIETDKLALIIEAKVGWSLPTSQQLAQYTPRLEKAAIGRILVVSECTSEFAEPRLPDEVAGVPVDYRSWRDIVHLSESCSTSTHSERHVLRDLTTYLRGLMTMQNHISNLVYVVSVGTAVHEWSAPFAPTQIVVERNRYFCPVGNGYPKEPPNYLGFRWHGKLQQIRHVDSYDVFTDPHQVFPEMVSREWKRHWLFHLGTPIVPPGDVRTGNLYRAQRVEAAIDILLTAPTIRDARDLTQARLAAAGEALT